MMSGSRRSGMPGAMIMSQSWRPARELRSAAGALSSRNSLPSFSKRGFEETVDRKAVANFFPFRYRAPEMLKVDLNTSGSGFRVPIAFFKEDRT